MLSLIQIALRGLRARPSRTCMTVAAIGLAVSLATALSSLGISYRDYQIAQATTDGGLFDLSVRVKSPAEGGEIRNLVRSTPGVAEAAGSLSIRAGRREPYDLIALGFEQSPSLGRLLQVRQGRLPHGPAEVALEEWAAREFALDVGEVLELSDLGGLQATVVGLVAELPGSRALRRTWVITTPEALGEMAGRPGELDTINIVLDPNASLQNVSNQLIQRVGPRGRIDLNEPLLEAREKVGSMGRILAVVILFTVAAGLTVTLNTFQISLMERMGEIGILRSLGMDRRHLARLWLSEGLLLGAAGGLAGILAGSALAPLLAFLARTYGSVQMPLLMLPWWIFPGGLALGIGVALVAGWLPVRGATQISVLTAMQPWRATDPENGPGHRRTLSTGVAVTTAGLALVSLLGLLGDEHPLGLPAGVAGILMTVAGATLLTPWWLALLLGRRKGAAGLAFLARANLLRHRRRTAVTLSTLLLAVTLLTAFSGLMQGQKVRAEAQLRERVPTDYVVDLHPSRGSLPPAIGKEVAGWPEVTGFATVKTAHVSVVGAARVGPMGARSLLLGIAAEQYLSLVGLRTPAEWLDALGAGAVLATRRAAGEFGLQPGDAVTFRRGAGGKTHRFIVAGVIDHEPETSMGAFLVDRRRLDQIDGTDVEHRYLITLNPGTDLNRFERRLKAVSAAASPDIVSQVEEREELARKAAEMLAYVGAMVGLIALIALSSIFNTFMASVRERTKEIGLMRSLGLSRVRLAALIAGEGALMGAIATLVGTVLGGLIAFLLGWSLNHEVSNSFLPPLILLGGIPLATLSLSVLSSLWPAWRAGQVPPATLLRVE